MRIKGIRAKVRFRGSAEGGREHAILSGYLWPLNFYPSQRCVFNDGRISFPDRMVCLPGETCLADILLFVEPEHVPVELREGVPFTVNQGPRWVIGYGEVLEVFYDDG